MEESVRKVFPARFARRVSSKHPFVLGDPIMLFAFDSIIITQSTQHDISQSEVLHLEHVQPIHHHHSLDQVSLQINVPT